MLAEQEEKMMNEKRMEIIWESQLRKVLGTNAQLMHKIRIISFKDIQIDIKHTQKMLNFFQNKRNVK